LSCKVADSCCLQEIGEVFVEDCNVTHFQLSLERLTTTVYSLSTFSPLG
jgi:hypothetical protein